MKKLIAIVSMMILSVSIAVAATVSGYVTDMETGEAIENAIVRFHFLDGTCPDGGGTGGGNGGHGNGGNGGGNGGHGLNIYDAVTDAGGYYTIVDLPEGNYEARALKPHTYMPSLLEEIVIDENGAVVDFVLEPCSGSGSAKQLKIRHLINF
ncbi:MAG: carboxypeptidase regulatory-like domain-containing protein [Candidatus Cloacimonetes bacterium]|nr:carboxypeptidase regulatory-like domain-containing protein [Candidatus Cloacimonadota bacterium]